MRDDRTWLRVLPSNQGGSPEAWRKQWEPLLKTIVTSLEFDRHTRWGVAPSEERLSKTIDEFLSWMESANEWDHHREAIRKGDKRSLPFALSRSYARFRAERQPRDNTASRSGTRSLLELPPPIAGAGAPITEGLLDAFSSMALTVPEDCRLSYQLHLEGLLAEEIATLFNEDVGDVAKQIEKAKTWIKGRLRGVGDGQP